MEVWRNLSLAVETSVHILHPTTTTWLMVIQNVEETGYSDMLPVSEQSLKQFKLIGAMLRPCMVFGSTNYKCSHEHGSR